MPSHHSSRPPIGLVALSAAGGAPGGGGPSFEKPSGGGLPAAGGGAQFEKPPGAIYQPGPPAGTPGGPVPQGGFYELAGWWRRVGATLLDSLILCIPFIPLTLIVFAGLGLSFGGSSDGSDASATGIVATILIFLVLLLVYLVVAFIYAPYFMSKWNGATPGKRALGIRVVRADGLPMTFGYAAYREVLVKYLLFGFLSSFSLGLATLIDYLWPLWDSEQRALHDIIVNTRVVRG